MAERTQDRASAINRARRELTGARQRRTARSWSPLTSASSYSDEDRYWLEREMAMLERALQDKGEMRRSELGNLVGCKYWGPGRFAHALKAAVDRGKIKHTGFGRYGPRTT
jgi:hypothetical protein